MTDENGPVPAPFDMAKVNACVEAMTPDQLAAVLGEAEEVAVEQAADVEQIGALVAQVRREARHWYDIPVEEAVNIVLPRPDIRGPVNEMGEPCPWPWKPQQMVGAPIGQHHCHYCDAMVVAGMRHLDYSGFTWERPEDHWINEDRYAQFRDAYGYARGHFSMAAEAFGKVDIVDAYWIWHCLQTGMDKPWPG